MLTVVMYHYVRELKYSRYPEIKGLSVELFREQIEYLIKHYTIIKMEDLIDSISSNNSLPSNSALLSFDDGYIDHYNCVFPILDAKKIQGSFFPPAKVIEENKVLDVNKIHYILASVTNKESIIEDIYSKIDEYGEEYSLEDKDYYYKNYAVKNRFDSEKVIFIKRILQTGLPKKLRIIITDYLFKKYVSEDEVAFAKELYMGIDQIKCMQRHGMYFGSHSYEHYWLNTLNPDEQEREIDLALKFLRKIGSNMDYWTMCYPYGGYNDSLLSILSKKNCKLGFTTEMNLVDIGKCNPLLLPRLDTNDLPKNRSEEPNPWTQKIK